MSQQKGAKGPSERATRDTSRKELGRNKLMARVLAQSDYQKRLAKVLREQEIS